MKTVRRSEIAERIKQARSLGDLSENAEYDEAKNGRGSIEARKAELEQTPANAQISGEDSSA